MATYEYTGTLTDFGGSPIAGAVPRLWVEADRDSYGPNGPLTKRRIPVTVASSGAFSMSLVASVDTSPEVRYLLRCEWLTTGSGGEEILAGWSEWDFTAAIGGGPIRDMVAAPASVWFIGPPWPATPIPGAFYLDREGDMPYYRYPA